MQLALPVARLRASVDSDRGLVILFSGCFAYTHDPAH
jgi:hypothetical protein